jgi:hypothetical protein
LERGQEWPKLILARRGILCLNQAQIHTQSLDYEGKQYPQKTLENKARVVNMFYCFKDLKA